MLAVNRFLPSVIRDARIRSEFGLRNMTETHLRLKAQDRCYAHAHRRGSHRPASGSSEGRLRASDASASLAVIAQERDALDAQNC